MRITMQRLPLLIHTAYEELLERSAVADFEEAFADAGAFTPKTIKGRRYWYFQPSTSEGRKQRYVGPETDALLQKIGKHRSWQDDRRERRALVSTLLRTAGVPRPNDEIGNIVATLARSGLFQRRSVLIGTVAYHTYALMLGVKLADAALMTDDIDIAQDYAVSLALEDEAPPILPELQKADPEFRSVPSIRTPYSVAYKSPRLRVDLLTSNRGSDTDQPVYLPALGSDALPLRFIDFLIRDPVPAVLLHGEGIYLLAPSPARYAIQKLIVSGRRKISPAKGRKDLQQAESLLEALAQIRADELSETWEEAWERGEAWRAGMTSGLAKVSSISRDATLRVIGKPRSILNAKPPAFIEARPIYDFDRDIAVLSAEFADQRLSLAISREALEDWFGADGADKEGRVVIVQKNRTEIEALMAQKYLHWAVEKAETLLVRTEDVPRLRSEISKQKKKKRKP